MFDLNLELTLRNLDMRTITVILFFVTYRIKQNASFINMLINTRQYSFKVFILTFYNMGGYNSIWVLSPIYIFLMFSQNSF